MILENTVTRMPTKQPVYKRQQFLLAFLQKLNSVVTATDLQKSIFMYSMANELNYYDFVPYKFGAYSFQLKQDVDVLHKDGYVTERNELVSSSDYTPTIFIDTSKIESLRGNDLVRKAYENYPYYAIRSEIAEKLLDSKALQAVHSLNNELTTDDTKLLSIGYEGKSIECFMNVLLKNGVKVLCDVRRNPLSRKYGFSRKSLKHIAESVGILYVHVPELGIDSEDRQSLVTPEDYRALFDEYRESLFSKTLFLQQVYQLINNNNRVALMCYEQDPNFCHRTVVKDYLTNSYGLESEDI